MEKTLKLVCDSCRAKSASLLSCIHTFGPRKRTPLSQTSTRDEDLRAVAEMVEQARHGS